MKISLYKPAIRFSEVVANLQGIRVRNHTTTMGKIEAE